MNLYLLRQSTNDDYDTYDSCVVCAESEDEAKKINPDGNYIIFNDNTCAYEEIKWWKANKSRSSWCSRLEDVKVTYLGIASDKCKLGEVICASFNAG